jgi:hypothetical protein
MNALVYCKPVLSFDACALKGKYKGVMMAATLIDGAGQILPLAWGTARFAQHLRRGLPQLKRQSNTQSSLIVRQGLRTLCFNLSQKVSTFIV